MSIEKNEKLKANNHIFKNARFRERRVVQTQA